jgi:hypothetical protein
MQRSTGESRDMPADVHLSIGPWIGQSDQSGGIRPLEGAELAKLLPGTKGRAA